jgi:hypothetical protein
MSDYIATIDDSGGVEPLMKWGGHFVEGDHPITCLTLLLLRTDAVDEFNERWLELRHEIREYLRCEQLPPIHLRIMYGRTLPATYRKGPNPYLGCPFEKIVEWVTKAFTLLEDFRQRDRVLHWTTLGDTRRSIAENLFTYFADPTLTAELRYLKEHSTGARKGMAKRYLNRMASPLLPLLVRMIMQINEYMRQLGGKSAVLQVDRFAEAHGFDAQDILVAVNRISNLTHVSAIRIMEDGDDVQLSQGVDLVGFRAFRYMMAQNGCMEPDRVLEEIVYNTLRNRSFVKANISHIVERRIQQHREIGLPIHYAAARLAIEHTDRAFADENMLTVEEFSERVKAAPRKVNGHSVLKPQILERLLNGEDPR